MRLGRTAFLNFLTQFILSISGFVATFLIARVLGPGPLGTYALGVALLFWLNVVPSAISQAGVKRISEAVDANAFTTAVVGLNAAVALVVGGALVVAGPWVDAFIGARVSGLLALIVIGDVAMKTAAAVLNGQKRVAVSGALTAVERVFRTLFQVLLIVASFGITALFVGHILSLVVSAVFGVVLIGRQFGRPRRRHVRQLLTYARFSWLGTLKTRAFGWMDTIVLGFFVSSTLIGIYEVSWTLASTLTLVSTSINQTLFPEFSDLNTTDRRGQIHHLLNEGFVFAGVFIIPGLFGAAILGDRILAIYRPAFSQGALVLVVLAFARLIDVFGSPLLTVINAIDRPDVAFNINLVFVVVNLVLNVVLVWQFGWLGAAVATGLSALVTLTLAYIAVRRLIGAPDIPLGEMGRQVVASALMAGVLLVIVEIIPRGHFITLGVVLAGAVIYLVSLLSLSTRVRQKLVGLVPSDRTVWL